MDQQYYRRGALANDKRVMAPIAMLLAARDDRNARDPLTPARQRQCMTNCDELVEHLEAESNGHVALAVTAPTAPVAAMHIDLAVFRREQTQCA